MKFALPHTPPESNGSKRKRKAISEGKQTPKGAGSKGKSPVKRRKKTIEKAVESEDTLMQEAVESEGKKSRRSGVPFSCWSGVIFQLAWRRLTVSSSFLQGFWQHRQVPHTPRQNQPYSTRIFSRQDNSGLCEEA